MNDTEYTKNFTAVSQLDKLLESLAQNLGGKASVNVVFGERTERDGVTVIPVAKVSWGFGGGGGQGGGKTATTEEGSGAGAGGGGGMAARPVGFIEIRDGEATYRPIIDIMAVAPYTVFVLMLSLFMISRIFGRIFR